MKINISLNFLLQLNQDKVSFVRLEVTVNGKAGNIVILGGDLV